MSNKENRPTAGRQLGLWLGAGALALAVLASAWLIARQILQPVDVTWQQMQERGIWRVGMDPSFPPFESLDAEGAPIGFDVDLARTIASEWGLELEIVAIGFDGLLDALLVRRVDAVISALPYDPRLTKDVHYSAPYFEAGVRLVVAENSDIPGVEALAGQPVAVEWGSQGDAVARRLQREGIPLERLTFPSPDEAIAALLAGDGAALLIDGVTLRLAQGAGQPLRAVGPALESDPYVIAVPIDATELQAALGQALQKLEKEGRLDALNARWFGRPP